jgi:hypothetical protein
LLPAYLVEISTLDRFVDLARNLLAPGVSRLRHPPGDCLRRSWQATLLKGRSRRGCHALLIPPDQYPRNMYTGSLRATCHRDIIARFSWFSEEPPVFEPLQMLMDFKDSYDDLTGNVHAQYVAPPCPVQRLAHPRS